MLELVSCFLVCTAGTGGAQIHLITKSFIFFLRGGKRKKAKKTKNTFSCNEFLNPGAGNRRHLCIFQMDCVYGLWNIDNYTYERQYACICLCTVYTGVHRYVNTLHGLDSVGFCNLIMCVLYLINNIEA